MGYNWPQKTMGMSASYYEGVIKQAQNWIKTYQNDLKNPNLSPARKKQIRENIAKQRDIITNAKENLKRAKEAAKKK